MQKICGKKGPATVLTKYDVKTSYQHKFLEVLGEYTLSAMRSTGNLMAEAYYERGDACVMWVIERWSSKAVYLRNKKSTAAKAVGALIKAGLASGIETFFITELESVYKEISPDALNIMLFVEVRPGTENHYIKINRELLPALRKDPGVLLFQFGQVNDLKYRFVVFKKFRNWDTFQYHLKEPALEPIIQFLQTSVKEQPFEKDYHHLIQFGQL